jgi:hypothetical protein
MPSLSRTQQRLFGQAYGVKLWKKSGGKRGINPKDLNPKYKKEIEKLADSMSMAKLKDFAETKHKRIPEEVNEKVIKALFFKLDPDSQYDSSKEKARRLANLSDYREFLHKKKRDKNAN